jgi:hypothetical protein
MIGTSGSANSPDSGFPRLLTREQQTLNGGSANIIMINANYGE